MQEHDVAAREVLGDAHSDSAAKEAGPDSPKWLVIDPDGQEYLEDLATMATAPPGVVWLPNRVFHSSPESFELYDSLDGYDWAAVEVWDMWHRNPTGYRAVRVVATGEARGGVSQYAAVEDRLLRDWLVDPASPEYWRLHEVACRYGSTPYDSWYAGEYGSGEHFNTGSEASRAAEVLGKVGGFEWLLSHRECTGTTDPYLALAVRPHIGRLIDQQAYDAPRRGFEEQHGELLHPDDQPLAGIRYRSAQAEVCVSTPAHRP